MRTLREVAAESGNIGNIVTDGETPMLMEDYVWNDILGYALARGLDSASGHIDYNYSDGTVDFDNSANPASDNDSFIVNYQLPHDCYRGAGAMIRPHVHWWQTSAGIPYWKVQYRILGNGDAVTPTWTDMTTANFTVAFPYTSGTISQIIGFEPIDISSCGLSCVIQVKVWRDGQNVLDTFGTGDVQTSFLDAHYPVAYAGSKDEYVQ